MDSDRQWSEAVSMEISALELASSNERVEMPPNGDALRPANSVEWPLDCNGEVQAFCRQHSLIRHLAIAIELAANCFHPKSVACELVQDGDSDEAWLVVRIEVHATIDAVLNAKKQYTDRWVAAVPWPQRHLIRLSYSIL